MATQDVLPYPDQHTSCAVGPEGDRQCGTSERHESGLDHECVVSCDNIVTIDKHLLGRPVGLLLDDQEDALATAIINAFALRIP